MDRRVYLAGLASASTAALAGCSTVLSAFDSEPCDGDNCDIGMTRTEFVPEEYTVSAGDTVVWKNTSEADHTVTAYENVRFEEEGAEYFATGGYDDFDTAFEEFWGSRGGRLGTQETFEHTFDVPGTYSYVCLPHEEGGMIGTIHVE
ncbi:plastocyanin/azurin family copper-binding protein [Halobacteria archaeon AArc-dxtr1]|nr:plastocyanin/azurin family copper-binding protein [Halobacteria archaeon AArc-dxtr1]